MTILLADMEATAYERKPEDIKWLVIHHSGTVAGSVESFRRYHRDVLGWCDVGYHYVICNGNGGPDGEIQPGRDVLLTGAHCVARNADSIGICVVGDFMQRKPTEKQMESLLRLCVSLCKQYDIQVDKVVVKVGMHKDWDATDCPGMLFDFDQFRNRLREVLTSERERVGTDPLVGAVVDNVAEVYLNGIPQPYKAVVIKGVSYIPTRDFATRLGCHVEWQPNRIDIRK